MSLSRGFITTLVDEAKINEVLRSGITSDFLDDEAGAVWGFIQRHYTEYRSVPSREAVIRAFPSWEFGRYKEPLEYYIDALKESYRRAEIDDELPHIADLSERDTKQAETALRDLLSKIQVTSKNFKDVSIADQATTAWEDYEKRKSNPGADGILSGWPTLDYQTLGWHPEEFVVLVGEKYMGKSWLMIHLALQAVLQDENVLFVTKEMSQEAVVRRMNALYAGVNFDRLRRGELTHVEEERFKEKMNELANSTKRLTVARQGVNTIEDIESKAVEADSTILFGDSIYLFPADTKSNYNGETAKRLAASQKCKEIAQRLGVPFIVSVQAGRKKSKNQEPDLDSIEWSNSFSQDADTVFFLSKDELDRELLRARMDLLKSRDGDLAKFFIDTDFDFMRFGERDDDANPTTEVFQEDEDEELDFND